jgi:hypothetical protein
VSLRDVVISCGTIAGVAGWAYVIRQALKIRKERRRKDDSVTPAGRERLP